MFHRHARLLSYGMVLFIGIAVGAAVDSWSFTTAVEAQAVNPERSAPDDESNPLVESSRALSEVVGRTAPSVVHIQSVRHNERGQRIEETGSGVVMVSPKAPGMFVVTNRHVVREAALNDVSIELQDGRVVHPLRTWTDDKTDVAVLKIAVNDLPQARWGDSDQVQIGHLVLAMGSPFGLSQSVTLGIISAKGRRSLRLSRAEGVLNQDFLQTDAAINPGNSGGPLVDMHGRVIGINTAIASNSGGNEGIGFSIPSNLVRQIVDQLLAYNTVRRAYLGVKLDPDFDPQAAQRLQLDRPRGARIAQVYDNTPASRAHLQFDDVILTFDGIEVQDENHLINLVSLSQVSERVSLVVWRNGRKVTVDVILADRSELEQNS